MCTTVVIVIVVNTLMIKLLVVSSLQEVSVREFVSHGTPCFLVLLSCWNANGIQAGAHPSRAGFVLS